MLVSSIQTDRQSGITSVFQVEMTLELRTLAARLQQIQILDGWKSNVVKHASQRLNRTDFSTTATMMPQKNDLMQTFVPPLRSGLIVIGKVIPLLFI